MIIRNAIFLGIYSAFMISTAQAADIHGYVLRNIDDGPINVCVEDHLYRSLANEMLEPNAELIFSLYYLSVMRAEKLRIFFKKQGKDIGSVRTEEVDLALKGSKIIKIHESYCNVLRSYVDFAPQEAQLILKSLHQPRIEKPKVVPILKKNISGYYFRNIDEIPLRVDLLNKQSGTIFKSMVLQPNEEFLLDVEYFKKNHPLMFTVITFYHKYTNYWKELHRSKLPSPCKEYQFDKVWNVLSLTTGFFSKHIEKPGTDKEIVAVRKFPGVSFEGFYKRTGLYKQREKPAPLVEEPAIGQQESSK